jgi:hypothetical protein
MADLGKAEQSESPNEELSDEQRIIKRKEAFTRYLQAWHRTKWHPERRHVLSISAFSRADIQGAYTGQCRSEVE